LGRRHLALERGGPKRLRLRWPLGLRRLEVALDEGTTWTVERPALRQGTILFLPGGASLFVRHVKRPWYSVGLRDELWVELDGVPVPGSDGDPRTLGRRAGALLVVLGLLQLPLAVALTRENRSGAWFLAQTSLLLVLGVLSFLGVRRAVLAAAGLFVLSVPLALLAPIFLLIHAAVVIRLVVFWRRMRPRVKTPNLGEIFE
jgi:hypothetical protein